MMYMAPFIHNVQNRQTTKEYTNGYQREEQKIAGNQNVPSFWDDRNVLSALCFMVMLAQHDKFTRNH